MKPPETTQATLPAKNFDKSNPKNFRTLVKRSLHLLSRLQLGVDEKLIATF